MGIGLFQGRRVSIGNRVLVPSGSPKRIGAEPGSAGLARVDEYGPSRSITLVIGQNKGKEPKNQRGACAREPAAFSVAAVDRAFAEARGLVVGRSHVEATRIASRGWYRGSSEKSVAYEVAYVPPAGGGPPDEKSFAAFQRNMDRLAERLAEKFCQDSVLIIRDDGSKRSVAAAAWDPKAKRRK